MRIAAIAIGSDSIQLVVIESDTLGNQRILAREKIPVALAKGLARRGKLDPEAFQGGLEALAWMAEILRGCPCDTVLACGAATLRRASDGERFRAESASLGIPIQVISGEEEARLLFQAVSRTVPLPEGAAVLLDLGDSSTHLTWTLGERVLASLSLPWGPQALADLLPTEASPTPEDVKRIRRFIRKTLKKSRKQLPETLPRPGLILGTSDLLSDLARAVGTKAGFTREPLLHLHRKLWRTNPQGRVERLGVAPCRAATLHVAASWVLGILDWLEADQVQCLPVGLREGLAEELLRHGGRTFQTSVARRHASVETLAAQLDPDPSHSRHVAMLADQLFTDLNPLFELGDAERELLAHAARLHDIGLSIAEKDHHKHGASLILDVCLGGFRRKEAELVAQIVRFHRGKAPSQEKHESYAQLAPWHRTLVEKLASILRTADALDRGHRQAVQSVRVSLEAEEALVHIQGSGDLRLELESLQEKGLLLFRLLDRPVRTLVTERR